MGKELIGSHFLFMLSIVTNLLSIEPIDVIRFMAIELSYSFFLETENDGNAMDMKLRIKEISKHLASGDYVVFIEDGKECHTEEELRAAISKKVSF